MQATKLYIIFFPLDFIFVAIRNEKWFSLQTAVKYAPYNLQIAPNELILYNILRHQSTKAKSKTFAKKWSKL